jgi:hypothetical protein
MVLLDYAGEYFWFLVVLRVPIKASWIYVCVEGGGNGAVRQGLETNNQLWVITKR